MPEGIMSSSAIYGMLHARAPAITNLLPNDVKFSEFISNFHLWERRHPVYIHIEGQLFYFWVK